MPFNEWQGMAIAAMIEIELMMMDCTRSYRVLRRRREWSSGGMVASDHRIEKSWRERREKSLITIRVMISY